MKIKIDGYPSRLICNIHSNHMNKKYGYVDWPDNQDYEDHVLEAIDDGIQSVYDVFNWIWFDRRTQKIKVRIDKWDTWSMDHTLAPIILLISGIHGVWIIPLLLSSCLCLYS